MNQITILSNSSFGLYCFRRELIERLITNGYSITVISPNDGKKEYFEKLKCRFEDIEIDRRGMNILSDINLFLKYLRLIREIKPDLTLSYTVKPNIYGGMVCSILGVPFICNITGLGSSLSKRNWLRILIKILYKLSLKKADCVFFQNESNLKYFLKNKIIKTNYKLIPGSGVNLNHFQVIDYPHDDIVRFLFIGRIMKEKGIDLFLEAAEKIKEKYDNTEFHLIGPCEEKYEKVLKEKEEQGIIIYHGMQRDVRKFYGFSHCTVHPTYYSEGMSNVLLESAASGRPVITTNWSGCREIVEDNKTGFLVSPKSTEDLIEKIENFLKLNFEEKKIMGILGRFKVEKEFDRMIVVNSYLDEIEKIIGLCK